MNYEFSQCCMCST